jgi:hypothetical protein
MLQALGVLIQVYLFRYLFLNARANCWLDRKGLIGEYSFSVVSLLRKLLWFGLVCCLWSVFKMADILESEPHLEEEGVLVPAIVEEDVVVVSKESQHEVVAEQMEVIERMEVMENSSSDEGGDSLERNERRRWRLGKRKQRRSVGEVDVQVIPAKSHEYHATELSARLAVEGFRQRPPLRVLSSNYTSRESLYVRYACGNRDCPFRVQVDYVSRRGLKGKDPWRVLQQCDTHTCPLLCHEAQLNFGPITAPGTDEAVEAVEVYRYISLLSLLHMSCRHTSHLLSTTALHNNNHQ